MTNVSRPLYEWFPQTREVHRVGIRALVFDDDWEKFLIGHRRWKPEQVVFVRCLLQPSREQIDEFLTTMVFDDGEIAPVLLETWHQPMSKCWEDSQLKHSERQEAFSFRCYLERGMPGMSGLWGYRATRCFNDWALLYDFGDEGRFIDCTPPTGFNERPLGFIDLSCPYRSAALLLSERKEASEAHNGFSENDYGWATSIEGKVDSAEIYRLLLARDGLRSDQVISMSADELKYYRPSGNGCGYEAIEHIHRGGP